jgi:3-oxoacyl-[acyl-carrier protein] reductase
MIQPSGDYHGKNCVIFGASGDVGQAMAKHLAQGGANLVLIDLASDRRGGLADEVRRSAPSAQIIHRTVTSGHETDFKEIVGAAADQLGGLDYLICTTYLEDGPGSPTQDDLELDTWDERLQAWVMNTFLVTRSAFPYLTEAEEGRVVFINTTTGYTGEGEGEAGITLNGSIHECACSSAITGMMTSIARDVIPKGVSVNGVALGPNHKRDMDSVIWATDFWLSGMCDYACGQILRLY